MRTIQHCLAASLLLAAGGETAAQNLVANSQFDTDTVPWTAYGAPIVPAVWNAEDCCGNSESGSLIHSGSSIGPLWVASNCIPITDGVEYDLQIMIRLQRGGVPTLLPGAWLTVAWFAEPDCPNIALHETVYSFDAVTYASWTQRGARMAAPPAVAYAQLRLDATPGLLSSTTVWIDDVRFGPAGSVPVGLLSFTVD